MNPNARTAALVGTLALVLLLGFLTISVAIKDGIDVLVLISIGILAMIGFGVIGALTTPPDE